MKTRLFIGAALSCALVSVSAFGDSTGEIKICRNPAAHGLTDGKSIAIPLSDQKSFVNTYTGACDSTGAHCRNIEVAVTKAGVIGAAERCVVLPAVLFQEDGKPVRIGDHLLPQWSIPGFEPVITVVKEFKP